MTILDLIFLLVLAYLAIGLILYVKDRRANPVTADLITIIGWPGRYR